MHTIRTLLRLFRGRQHSLQTTNMSKTTSSSKTADNTTTQLSSSSSSSSPSLSLTEPADQGQEQAAALVPEQSADPAADVAGEQDSGQARPAAAVAEAQTETASCPASLAEAVTALGVHIRSLLAGMEVVAPATAQGEGCADQEPEDASAALAEALRHGCRVQVLALELYDALCELHGLPAIWRDRLSCAALLHDIGQIFGMKKHHRNTLALMLQKKTVDDAVTAELVAGLISLVPAQERCRTALIGRYHRKAWPSLAHEEFAALSLQDRLGVSVCAALLRIGDALDVGHTGEVKSLHVHYDRDTVILEIEGALGVHAGLVEHARRARSKGDLFMELFAREITWRLC